MEKLNKLTIPLALLTTAVIFLVIINGRRSYPTLKEAVRATSNGGVVAEKMKCKTGYYVFINDSSVITSGFYYEKNHRWYYDSNLKKDTYQLNDNIEVSIYYVFNQDMSILEISQKEPEDLVLSDSLGSAFKGKKDNSKQYLAIIYHRITSDYRLTINEKEYQVIKK